MYLTTELPDAKDVKLKLKPAGHFDFSAKGADDLPYELDLELFDVVNVEVGVLIWAEFGSWMCNYTC
jgi:cytosolic prostaglandin-E synthase